MIERGNPKPWQNNGAIEKTIFTVQCLSSGTAIVQGPCMAATLTINYTFKELIVGYNVKLEEKYTCMLCQRNYPKTDASHEEIPWDLPSAVQPCSRHSVIPSEGTSPACLCWLNLMRRCVLWRLIWIRHLKIYSSFLIPP